MTDYKPKISMEGRWMEPQDFSEYQHAAVHAMLDTGFGCVAYGYGTYNDLKIYIDSKRTIPPYQAYKDGVSLALGIFTINLEHDKQDCTFLICNCKIH